MKMEIHKRKLFITLFVACLGLSTLVAQDTTNNCHVKKTFVIRKSKSNSPNLPTQMGGGQPKNEESVVAVSIEKKIKRNSSLHKRKNNSFTKGEQALSYKDGDIPAKMPTLAGGEFGLMDIQPYQKGMKLYNWNFVILQYSINQYGWTTKVNVLDSNNSVLKKHVLSKLKQSRWNPAISKAGKPMECQMYQQVVIVKDRIYEEDYINK